MKIVAVIPAHLASVRFPGKILHDFHGLPMIEHVRRRALLSENISDVYVATCEQEIAKTVSEFGGNVIMTSDTHKNGTTRVAEAIKNIDCTHVILLQGDEPLLLPRHVDTFAESILNSPDIPAWNATGPIETEEELDRHSFVKCSVTTDNDIMYCFRRSPCYSKYEIQKNFIRKILGIIAFKKSFLLELVQLPVSQVEKYEFIEQMRIVENKYLLKSVPVSPSLPSVNEPDEANIVLNYIDSHPEQKELLDKVLNFSL